MKPLTNIASFLDRFDNFKDGEFRSIEVISPTNIQITLAGQDKSRDFDWISVTLEFSGTDNARLLEKSKLPFIDMGDGINITTIENKFLFGVGDTHSNLIDSLCFVSANNIKYQEGNF